jgi:hypothetical protein
MGVRFQGMMNDVNQPERNVIFNFFPPLVLNPGTVFLSDWLVVFFSYLYSSCFVFFLTKIISMLYIGSYVSDIFWGV